jgi:ribosome-associated toxin RatA of RatAB toxin-antitoxin module
MTMLVNRLLTTLLLGCACSAWSAAALPAQPAAPPLDLTVRHADGPDGGKAYRIASSGTVAARPAVAWRILTDYGHLAEVVPNLKSARVLARDGDKVMVEQVGAARFLFFSRAVRLVVLVHEQAPDKIDVSLVEGDMKVYRCSWELVPLDDGGTRVLYRAAIEPAFYVPEMIGTNLVRKDIARMMTAVLSRMERDK